VPLGLEPTLEAVPGVARVAPSYQGTAILAGKDGTAVGTSGAPALGFAFRTDDTSFTLVHGRGPTGPGEVAVESVTLAKSGLAVGDSTTAVIAGHARPVVITGEVTFGALFGATAVLVDEATARSAFAPDGTVASFSIAAKPGVTQQVLRQSIAQVLPASDEAVTGATVTAENTSSVGVGLGYLTTFLLAFAGVALFVGSFIIVNTFSMLVAQRTRELALLRAIGASRGQVVRSVLAEAVVIGVIGSALGLVLGLAIAAGAKSLVRSTLGTDIVAGLPVHPSTVLWSVAVGTLVTVGAAVLPARRASRIAPVAAMRDDVTPPSRSLRRRGAAGAALLAVGAILLAVSVSRSSASWLGAGLAAALAVAGMLVGAPLAARPVVTVVTWPFTALAGVIGRLARQNALRVPRRTAATASALMIGLALVTGVSVIAASVKASVADVLARQLTSDFVLGGAGSVGIPSSVGPAAADLPQVRSVARISTLDVTIGKVASTAVATTAPGLADNFVITMRSGRLAALAGDTVLVSQSAATAHGWVVGAAVKAAVGTLTGHQLTIGGVFQDSQALGTDLIVDRALYDRAVPVRARSDLGVYVRAVPGADLTALRAGLVALVKPLLIVSVQDGKEFNDSTAASVDTLLNLLYVLLLFSVIVAVLGIVNTLALSIVERTREIGLLRAVGLRRRQLSGVITVEAIATALFGAVLGSLLGLGLGIAMQRGLRSQGLELLAIPWTTIVMVLAASMVVGVIAAVLPSARAVRLNILRAITTEA
jgi:putative ABC transport system permease protein